MISVDEIPYQRHFYPRSPCGERPSSAPYAELRSVYFYPRSPCGERQFWFFAVLKAPEFLSTLSLRRATREPTAFRTPHHNFYPRSPCGERRAPPYNLMIQHTFLSTLSLRRATHPIGVLVRVVEISIHALLAESDAVGH